MLMLVPLGMFRFWGERSKVLKVAAAACTAACLIGSVLTFSRGGAVGLALTLVIMAVMRYIKLRDILIVVAALALVLIMTPQNLERLTSLQALAAVLDPETTAGIKQTDGAVQGRATEMLAAGLVFLDHPLVGVGPGMFPYYVEEYARGLNIRLLTTTREAHMLYLGIAAEEGVLGLLCFMTILLITLRGLIRGHKRWRLSRPDLANMNASFMFVIIMYMTTGLFLHMSYLRYFWMMLALANVASYLASHVATSEQPDDPAIAGSVVPAQRPVAG
jgi:O-antigen ligase